MSKILKKITYRYLKSFIHNSIASNAKLANKFRIYNQAINYQQISGNELINRSDDQGQIFIAKEINNALVAENTGCSLYFDHDVYKVIQERSGAVHRNWVKFCLNANAIKEITTPTINLIGVHKGYRHYFHIFFDYVIPLLFFLQNNPKNYPKIQILVRQDHSKVQKELYQLITTNFKNVEFVYVEKNQFILCHQLIYIQHFHNAFYDYARNADVSKVICWLRDNLVKKYHIENTPSKQKNIIFISRKKARLRRMINEQKFINFLSKLNFKVVTLEDMSFSEQIACFYNAKLVVATHGAGFLNLIFAQQGLHFLEIFPKKYYGGDYNRISNIMQLNRTEYIENNEIIWQCYYLNIEKIAPLVNTIYNKAMQNSATP